LKTVIQRVSSASVTIDAKIVAEIQKGLLVLVGIEDADTQEDIDWLCQKITNLRIFAFPTPALPEGEGAKSDVMNFSVKDIDGEIIVVSQFTLHASTKKGNRPSYIKAAKPEVAIPLYEQFVLQLEKELGKKVQTGIFGADMKVSLLNDGPVTILIDSKNKE
jgi:D-aminoacyl-tRNA deacylase